jgi:hypothetical protein
VRVQVQDVQGVAWIRYECTAGEVVRAFALDVAVNRGQIVGITDYLRGESKGNARGYGVFPASFRDHLTVNSGTNVNWDVAAYSPVAVTLDAPGSTLPGLNTSGVTLEFGALWDPAVPTASPAATGTLCALQLSEAAQVSVGANALRGGVVSASADRPVTPVFVGAWVDPAIRISAITMRDGTVTISFQGGELETATSVEGPWTGTGNFSGEYVESVGATPARFYRVHRH